MGPNSKTAIVEMLGALLVEARLNRAELRELRSALLSFTEGHEADNQHTSRRVTQIERKLREHGIELPEVRPIPAE